jgi:hypothetical protein
MGFSRLLIEPDVPVQSRRSPFPRPAPRQWKNVHKSESKKRAASQLFPGYFFFTKLFMASASADQNSAVVNNK